MRHRGTCKWTTLCYNPLQRPQSGALISPVRSKREVRMGEGRDKEIQIHRKNKQGSQQCCYKHLPGQLPEQLFQLRHACHVRSTAHPISADQVGKGRFSKKTENGSDCPTSRGHIVTTAGPREWMLCGPCQMKEKDERRKYNLRRPRNISDRKSH